MSMYQHKNLELLYTQNAKCSGKITHQSISTLKSLAKARANDCNAVSGFAKALSTFFCFMFRPKFVESSEQVRTKIYSENSNGIRLS